MEKRQMTVLSNREIARDTFEMTLKDSYICEKAKPGQFLHMSVPNFTLRRPLSIAATDQAKETVTVVYKIVGAGTKQLSLYQEKQTIDVLGPNGSHFSLGDIENQTILLIGGGVGIPPLHFLGEKLKQKNIQIKSILGFQSRDDLFYKDEFQSFGESIIVTDDGSEGKKGLVTDGIGDIGEFDLYYTCGPLPMIKAVVTQLANKKGFISLEERMGCGVGACFACVIPTWDQNGYRKICEDGPVFSAGEVRL